MLKVAALTAAVLAALAVIAAWSVEPVVEDQDAGFWDGRG